MTLHERLVRARSLLLLDHPFLGTLATRMPLVEDRGVKTGCTNGVDIRYNPKWVESLTDAQLMFFLAHEVFHVANGHIWRRGGRDLAEWNVAADYAINGPLVGVGLTPPEGALLDPTYGALSAEEVYSRRSRAPTPKPQQSSHDNGDDSGDSGPGGAGEGEGEGQDEDSDVSPKKPQSKGGKGKGQGPGQEGEEQDESGSDNQQEGPPDPGRCGGVEDAPEGEAGRDLETEWRVAVSQAAQAARGQGLLPADMERAIKEFINPSTPWEVLLRDFVERTARNDYNWAHPSRRHMGRGFILPSLVSEELPAVVVAVDTSRSIDQPTLERFASEVSAVLMAYDTTVHLVYCDARVQGVEEYTRTDLPLRLKPKGGGGTDFRPVFDWVGQQGLEPSCLIYLTDMMGTFPTKAPEYPVLWVATTDTQGPFGDTVQLVPEKGGRP